MTLIYALTHYSNFQKTYLGFAWANIINMHNVYTAETFPSNT